MIIRHKNQYGPRAVAGFTLIEIIIAMAISSLVMFAVVSLQTINGYAIKDVYGQTQTRCSRMIALDQVRYRLINAKIGSCVISSSEHRIDFTDPNLKGPTSAFYFVSAEKSLYYLKDTSNTSQASVVVRGPIDITFEILDGGEMVKLLVKSASSTAHGDVDIQDGETSIYLRNP